MFIDIKTLLEQANDWNTLANVEGNEYENIHHHKARRRPGFIGSYGKRAIKQKKRDKKKVQENRGKREQ